MATGHKATKQELLELPEYKPLSTILGADEDVDASAWTTRDVAEWLHSIGLGRFDRAFAENKVTGDLLHILNEDHLKELGVKLIGDRVLLLQQIARLWRGAVHKRRFRTIWEADGLMYSSGCCDWFTKQLMCYPCCQDPDHYRLTGSTLYLSEEDRKRRKGALCATSKYTRAIDLSAIVGVNDYHKNSICDCFCAGDVITIELDKEKGLDEVSPMIVRKGDGHAVALKIQAAMEEAQTLAPGAQHMLRM